MSEKEGKEKLITAVDERKEGSLLEVRKKKSAWA